MPYETRIILFVDILGFKNDVIKSSRDEEAFVTLQTTLEFVQTLFKVEDYDDIEKLQFSDSLVISMKANSRGAVCHMISQASYAMHALFANGYLCKGVISIGKLFHKGDILFGPEFLNVMKAEGLQEYPMITFNQDLIELARLHPSIAQVGYEDEEVEFIMNHADAIPGTSSYKIAWYSNYSYIVDADISNIWEHYRKIKINIETNIVAFKKVRVLNKYIFLKEEFNNSEYLRRLFPEEIIAKPNNWKKRRFIFKTIGDNISSSMKKLYWKMQQ